MVETDPEVDDETDSRLCRQCRDERAGDDGRADHAGAGAVVAGDHGGDDHGGDHRDGRNGRDAHGGCGARDGRVGTDPVVVRGRRFAAEYRRDTGRWRVTVEGETEGGPDTPHCLLHADFDEVTFGPAFGDTGGLRRVDRVYERGGSRVVALDGDPPGDDHRTLHVTVEER